LQQQLQQHLLAQIQRSKQHYKALSSRLYQLNPRNKIKQQHLHLALLKQRLYSLSKDKVRQKQQQLQRLSYTLQQYSPEQSLVNRQTHLQHCQQQLFEKTQAKLQHKAIQLQLLVARLNSVNPLSTLQRGYCISQDAHTGAVIQNVSQVKSGQKIKVVLQHGEFIARVE